jgi:hypothetical protein
MTYHIPTDEKVKKAVKKVFSEYNIVSSQHKLKKLVEKQLKTPKKQFSVSEFRLRNIVLKNKLATIEIHSREGDPNKVLNRCPVCDNQLQRVKNLTIWGGKVTIEFRCNKCGYWTGKKKRIPNRYVFHKK